MLAWRDKDGERGEKKEEKGVQERRRGKGLREKEEGEWRRGWKERTIKTRKTCKTSDVTGVSIK